MEQKIKAVKTSSEVLAVLSKIGYTVMIVMICISSAMLIFLGVTGGTTSRFTVGKTNIIIFDSIATSPAELAAICPVLIAMGGMLLAIFLLVYKMLHEISQTGEPFEEKYVKTVRTIGILTAVAPIVTGVMQMIATLITKTDIPNVLSEIQGIGFGAVIFCLSFFIDYGCGLRQKLVTGSQEKTE